MCETTIKQVDGIENSVSFFLKPSINLIKLEIWYGNNNSKFALIILLYLLFTNVWNTDNSFHHNTLSGKSVINKWWSDIILSAFQYRGVKNLPDRQPGIQHSANAKRQCYSYSKFCQNLFISANKECPVINANASSQEVSYSRLTLTEFPPFKFAS